MSQSTSQFYRRLGWRFLADLLGPADTETNGALWERKASLLRRSGLRLGDGVIVMSQIDSLVSLNQNIQIGDHCVIGPRAHFWAFHQISVGACTVLGAEVSLLNGGHDIHSFEPTAGPMKIGAGCWLGHGVKVVRPVTIGDNVIVEPGSVVTEDLAAGTVAAGVPAKVIRQRELPERVWLWGDRYFSPITFTCLS